MASPKKWWEIYNGDDEKNFFVGKNGKSGLARHPDFTWRTTESIAKESGLNKILVEKLIEKHFKTGLVIQHAKDPEKWAYWENVKRDDKISKGVAQDDKDNRIEKAKTKI